LGAVPVNAATTRGWQKLDKYVAKHAFAAVFGYQTFPFFTSSRITVKYTSSIYGWDLLGIAVK
ncbi:MAG: hypothetical protein KGL16_10315, partial [Acidobacteriota bacterium]|nr:hypothetical protein [Acidobacteriota bacterium]